MPDNRLLIVCFAYYGYVGLFFRFIAENRATGRLLFNEAVLILAVIAENAASGFTYRHEPPPYLYGIR